MSNHHLSEITLEQIQLFLRAVETGSFTETGRGLFMTQSSISRKMAALENALGLQLFSREHRKIRPTSAGKRLYQALDGMIIRFEAAVAAASKEGKDQLNTIKVGVLDPLLLDKLMDVIGSFRMKYRMTVVRVETCELSDLRINLFDNGLDVIFTMAYESPSFSSLYDRYVFDEGTMYVYMSREYLNKVPQPLKTLDFSDEHSPIYTTVTPFSQIAPDMIYLLRGGR